MTSLIETGETIERGETKTTYDTSLIELDLGMCVKTIKRDVPKKNYQTTGRRGRRLSSYNMSTLPESTELFSKIPDDAYIICVEYVDPKDGVYGEDLQIGITGTPKYKEGGVSATKREIKEELGLDASDDYINLSYFGKRIIKPNTTWYYWAMDTSGLTIPTKRTYNDTRTDWGKNQHGFYKVMVIPWTTNPDDFIKKIKESAEQGGMDQLLADDIKKIVLVPKSVVLEWYPQLIKRLDRPDQPKDKTRNSALSKMLARQGGQKKYRGKTKKHLKQRTNRTKKRNKK